MAIRVLKEGAACAEPLSGKVTALRFVGPRLRAPRRRWRPWLLLGLGLVLGLAGGYRLGLAAQGSTSLPLSTSSQR